MAPAIGAGISWAATQALGARMTIDRSRITPVTAVQADPQAGSRMVTALASGEIGFWDLEHGTEIRRVPAHPGGIASVALGASLAVSIGRDGRALAWDPRRSTRLGEIALRTVPPGLRLAQTEDGTRSDAGRLGEIAVAVPASLVAVQRDGQSALLAFADRTVRIWSAGGLDPVPLAALDAPAAVLALSPNGGWAAIADQAGQIRLVSLADRSSRRFKADRPVFALFADDAGRGVLAVLKDGEVRRIDFAESSASRLSEIDETVTAAAQSPDGRVLAVADDDGALTLLATASGERIRRLPFDHPVRSLSFVANGAALLAATEAGTVRVIDANAGLTEAELIAGHRGWVVVDADGSFDSAREAEAAVSWEANGKSFGAAQFTQSHFEPGLLAMAVERSLPVPSVKLSKAFTEPAEVRFVEPATGGAASNQSVTVTVTARDLGDGIEAVRLYHDDREVAVNTTHLGLASPVAEGKPVRISFPVTLHPGDNELEVDVVGRSRVASKPAALHLSYSGQEAKPALHVLTIGINEYRNPVLSLNYGVPDAQGIAKFFQTAPAGPTLFGTVEVASLTNAQVVREPILAALGKLEQVSPDDVVVIYLAGHGDTREDKWYFIPYDVTYPERSEQLRERGLSSEELHAALQRIPARKVLLLIDACKSGAVVSARQRGFEERKTLVKLARAAGTHIVAAAAKEQFASELTDLGHGAFTYALLQGLAGKAAGGQDQTVTVRSLVSFVEDYLPDLSSRNGDQPQFPVVDSRGMDFPLSVAPAKP